MTAALALVWRHQLALVSVNQEEPLRAQQVMAAASPFAGEGWRPVMWWLAWSPSAESAALDQALLDGLSRYPLEGSAWMRRAEVAATLGQPESQVKLYLDLATQLSGFHTPVLWRSAVVADQLGDSQRLFAALRAMLLQSPGDVARGFGLASRWASTPDALAAELVGDNVEVANAALGWAARSRQRALAEAALQRLDDADIDPSSMVRYVSLLIAEGDAREALLQWSRVEPEAALHGISNADFAVQPARRQVGMDWRGALPPSVELSRDAHTFVTPPASLRWRFAGTHNVDLRGPLLPIAVEPGASYELHLHWTARGLSSVSLPELQVINANGRTVLASVPAASSAWDWTPVVLNFVAPEDSELVHFRLRRAPTGLLERQLGGTVNIDQLRLRLVAAEASS